MFSFNVSSIKRAKAMCEECVHRWLVWSKQSCIVWVNERTFMLNWFSPPRDAMSKRCVFMNVCRSHLPQWSLRWKAYGRGWSWVHQGSGQCHAWRCCSWYRPQWMGQHSHRHHWWGQVHPHSWSGPTATALSHSFAVTAVKQKGKYEVAWMTKEYSWKLIGKHVEY